MNQPRSTSGSEVDHAVQDQLRVSQLITENLSVDLDNGCGSWYDWIMSQSARSTSETSVDLAVQDQLSHSQLISENLSVDLDIPRSTWYDHLMMITETPTGPAGAVAREAKINSTLLDALTLVADARDQLAAVGALGMVDDLRRATDCLDDMINWTLTHPDWTTVDLDACQECRMHMINCEC